LLIAINKTTLYIRESSFETIIDTTCVHTKKQKPGAVGSNVNGKLH
jgi:hypothetical protein